MAQGQRIYTLTADNAQQLNNITIDEGARAEIQQALAQGLEVTVHQAPINVNGWQGSGYAILNADYGLGAYKISGGASGSFLTLATVALVSILGIVVTSTSILVSMPILVLLASVSFAMALFTSFVGPDFATYEFNIEAIEHIAGTLIFTNLLKVAGILGAATLPIFFVWLAVAIIPILIRAYI